ncbi:MAG: 2-oxoacid ferredoxin oxidoreductase, partial [Candidatus ainarchaeum sp.]|nr:2-oxoacid ferredoxin oxidoreductase [Candidatus ainarchaeum sp.]
VTFNKLNTYDYFTKRCYKLQDSGHDTSNVNAALDKAFEAFNTNYEKIPIGVFYKADRPTYEEQQPQLKEKALVEQDLSGLDISAAYADMM